MAETRRILREISVLSGDGSVISYADHVLLRNRRSATTEEEVDYVIKMVDRELGRLAKPALIIDTSAVTAVSSDKIRERFSTWLQTKKDLGRIGWIVQKEMHQIAVNMSSVSAGAKIRSFLSQDDALKWMNGK